MMYASYVYYIIYAEKYVNLYKCKSLLTAATEDDFHTVRLSKHQ